MNQKRDLPVDTTSLLDMLDAELSAVVPHNDLRTTPILALAFCDLLADSLDEDQKMAIESARQFLAGFGANDHEKFVARFAERIDSDQRLRTPKRDTAMNRLVWAALNENTEFSGYAAEFLVGLGEDAGLAARQMAEVFREQLPSLGW